MRVDSLGKKKGAWMWPPHRQGPKQWVFSLWTCTYHNGFRERASAAVFEEAVTMLVRITPSPPIARKPDPHCP